MALVPQVVDAVQVPVIASGGIMDGRGIAAAPVLGAQGVQLGTAFLTAPRPVSGRTTGRAPVRPTTVTDVLTGRHARAVRTPLVERLEAVRRCAAGLSAAQVVPDRPPLLAGQGGRLARSLPAGGLVRALEAGDDTVRCRELTLASGRPLLRRAARSQTSKPSRRAERAFCRLVRNRRSRRTSSGSSASAAGLSMTSFSTW